MDSASKAITVFIIKQMSQELSDRMMCGFAENESVMAPAAKDYLNQRKTEEQIAYDEAMKRKHASIVEAKHGKAEYKPRPTQIMVNRNSYQTILIRKKNKK